MNQDAASLDRLHDIVMPPTVPWWPPAPGWYVLAAIILGLLLVLVLRLWLRWRATAYRREAIRALDSASDPAAIAALLRRTALAESSRSEIAALHGNAWWTGSRPKVRNPSRRPFENSSSPALMRRGAGLIPLPSAPGLSAGLPLTIPVPRVPDVLLCISLDFRPAAASMVVADGRAATACFRGFGAGAFW